VFTTKMASSHIVLRGQNRNRNRGRRITPLPVAILALSLSVRLLFRTPPRTPGRSVGFAASQFRSDAASRSRRATRSVSFDASVGFPTTDNSILTIRRDVSLEKAKDILFELDERAANER
jgi:hypothetical protein